MAVWKVLVIVPFAFGEGGLANRRAQMQAVKLGPEIDFEFRGVKAGPALFDSYHDLAIADVALFEAGKNAQEEGYDAVCIDTMSDSGMNALRFARSTGQCNTACSLSAGVWKPKVFRGR